ncbi:MAG: alpha/beta hydrolase family protein [Caldimonas sp.]
MAAGGFAGIAAVVIAAAAGLTLPAAAHGAEACDSRLSAGYRVLSLASGRKMALWYPSRRPESRHAYSKDSHGLHGSVAADAAPAECGAVPLVVFSHGLGGCGIQSVFFTEELARHGYVVAAPDHRDAWCATDGPRGSIRNVKPDASFTKPEAWSDESHADRRKDLEDAIAAVAADGDLRAIADTARIGAVGHSLGGYTVVGLAGGWTGWKDDRVRAVLAMSPYLAPYAARGSLGALGVPVMLQGAEWDWGLTPAMEGERGAYAALAAPKYFVKLKGGTHFEWTNLACLGEAGTLACLQRRPNIRWITTFGIEFLDRHLKDKPSRLLDSESKALAAYSYSLR